LGREIPLDIDHVIDLTCEFPRPKTLREFSYHSFPILDGFVPSSAELQTWVANAAKLPGTIYIHCAEGHGRTGLFAAALLFELGQCASANDALQFVKSKRPLVRLGKRQQATLAMATCHENSSD
jgi:protein-tyrosine phosphatase